MATIITRLYADSAAANAASRALLAAFLPQSDVSVIAASEGQARDAILKRLEAAEVHETAVSALADKIASGGAAVVVRATYIPLGAARITREILADSPAVDLGSAVTEHRVKDRPDHAPGVLKTHPRFLTVMPRDGRRSGGLVSDAMGIRTLSRQTERRSAISGGRLMTFGPFLTSKSGSHSAMSGTRHMGRWFGPLLSHRERSSSVIPDGGHPLSRLMRWPTISRAR